MPTVLRNHSTMFSLIRLFLYPHYISSFMNVFFQYLNSKAVECAPSVINQQNDKGTKSSLESSGKKIPFFSPRCSPRSTVKRKEKTGNTHRHFDGERLFTQRTERRVRRAEISAQVTELGVDGAGAVLQRTAFRVLWTISRH